MHRKLFLRHFQKTLFRKSFFLKREIAQTRTKRRIFEKKVFCKSLRKSFLCTSSMRCRYLECSSDPGLFSNNFRMFVGHVWGILLIKNEKLTVFAKRYVARSVCKGLKKPYFDDFFDFKCL